MRRGVAVALVGCALGLALAISFLPDVSPGESVLGSHRAEQALAQARVAFAQGQALRRDPGAARMKFAEAADALATLSTLQPTADVYHDLGNASLLAGRLPEAIAAFHKGLRLAPDDRRLRQHLDYARELVPYGEGVRGRPMASRWPAFLPAPTTLLAWGMLLCYALALPLLTWGLTTRRWGWVMFAGLLGAAIAPQYMVRQALTQPPSVAVIASDDVAMHQGNGPSFPLHPSLPTLGAGMEGTLVARRGGWLFLAFSTGEFGWVPQAAALVVE